MREVILQMTQKIYCCCLFLGLTIYATAQETEHTPLFQSNDILEARLHFSFRDIKKSKSDTVYHTTQFYYKEVGQDWDSIKVRIRGRGKFRRENCFFTPIKMKIKKEDRAGTLFQGNKNLKLVMRCRKDRSDDDLVVKEYMCYKLYESISPYAFSTRLMDLSLTNEGKRKSTDYKVKAFIIEDDKQVAKRANAEVLEGFQRNTMFMQDSLAALQDVFQYMIGNTDWSSDQQHNVKMMLLPSKAKVPVPYDYDMSGLVNASYSEVNPLIPVENVRERHFRGLCRDEELGEYVRLKYIELEPTLWETVRSLRDQMRPHEVVAVEDYLEDFFSLVKDRKKFEENILQKCRKLE
ncbi:MAG: hypothetical protein WBL21_09405 [Salinimicrobium sp.]